MAKIWMDDKVGLDKFDPYKDTLVTTVRGTAEEVREVLDKLMGDETNKIKRNTVSLRQKWISVKERMPEAEQKVLVYAVGYAFGFEGDTVMAITCQSMHRDGSMYWHSPWQYFQSDYKITHWMPLPPCPEQEDDDDA